MFGDDILLTEAEFLALPEYTGSGTLDGRLVELPPAKRNHSKIVRELCDLLRAGVDDTRVWSNAVYRLKERRWLIPDVSVSWPDQPCWQGWLAQAAIIVVEAASWADSAADIDMKVGLYLDSGSAEVWVIYPLTSTMNVFRRDQIAANSRRRIVHR